MLGFKDKPVFVNEREDIVIKVAELHGSDPRISRVAALRADDPTCRQLPCHGPVPDSYHVIVRYKMAEDGYILIQLIRVSFDPGKPEHWTCFYEQGAREGKAATPIGSGNYYFLDSHDVAQGVGATIARYEERQALRRLTRQGPQAIPEEEDEDFDPMGRPKNLP